ncbi:unnamed protein product, partial [Mesorhabditis spiculigera]
MGKSDPSPKNSEAPQADSEPRIETRCSFFGFHPEWLQKFCVFPVFLTIVCANAFVQGMVVNGFTSISIQSLERRFALTSTESSIFAGSYDVAVGLTLIPIAFVANKVNKVRTMGWGMVLASLGVFLVVIPQFWSGYYEPGSPEGDTCVASRERVCTEKRTEDFAFPLLVLGQLLIGFGASPLFTFGYSTIDEFDSNQRTGRNMALYLGACTLGPAMAFPIGTALLKTWGDIGITEPNHWGITSDEDPRWYGAWWVGWLMSGFIFLITGIPLTMFPKKLRDTDNRKAKDELQPHADLMVDLSNDKWELFKLFKLFSTNPTCMCIIVFQTLESLLMNGFITYVPKLLENLFSITAGLAALTTGVIVIPMGLIGNLLGGKLGDMEKNRVPGLLKWCIACMAINTLCAGCLLLPCEGTKIAGINEYYRNATIITGLDEDSGNGIFNRRLGPNLQCNRNCSCDRKMFNPVCDESTKTSYLSPCHAGCHVEDFENSTWSECACLDTSERVLTKGWCSGECPWVKYAFFVLFAVMALFTFATGPLIQNAALKVVAFEHRDAYICYSWMWMRFAGSIPGVLAMGKIIDTACVYWKSTCFDEQGSCSVYDSNKMRIYLFVMTILVKILCVVAAFSGRYFFKPGTGDDSLMGQVSVADAVSQLEDKEPEQLSSKKANDPSSRKSTSQQPRTKKSKKSSRRELKSNKTQSTTPDGKKSKRSKRSSKA